MCVDIGVCASAYGSVCGSYNVGVCVNDCVSFCVSIGVSVYIRVCDSIFVSSLLQCFYTVKILKLVC